MMVIRSSLLLFCGLLLLSTEVAVYGQPSAENTPDPVLTKFVGVWNLSNTQSPAKWAPEGGTSTGLESTIWSLKNRIILIRDLNQPSGRKGLYISTHDAEKKVYPLWCFDSDGLMGTQWELTWDTPNLTALGHATDLPTGWTSGGKNDFSTANTNLVTSWIKDEQGVLLMENSGRKVRLPADREADIVAAWKHNDRPAELSMEQKVLDRMTGTWDTVRNQKPAEWTPAGGQSTAVVKREWILDGRFLMDTSDHSDGTEGLGIFAFDPATNAFRGWWFHSLGLRNQSTGTWNAHSQTLSMKSELPHEMTMHSSVRFASQDTEVWKVVVNDARGKVYFDMDIIATRRPEKPVE